ncbi:Secreted protein OS=Streptomyces tendae OX=1932 GN=GUR47_15670 PE=4 SV=1 [Streptomyces tendae]
MSIRIPTRRATLSLAVLLSLTLGAVGCSSSGGDDEKPEATVSASTAEGDGPSAQEGNAEDPLAELQGSNGLLLRITSAERDSGGFVTVNGELKNDGDKSVAVPSGLSGNETEIIKNGRSLGGATLVDSKSKKRYYVLRDTEGRPLTTTGLSTIKAGDRLAVFMQFPSPPAATTEVTFQLPTFASATISISG